MWKKREWYLLDADERMRVMRDHIEVARRFTGIETNTAYSFGLDDQEFVVAFDADDPSEFLDLVQELRATESSAYTESETPIFTCLRLSVERALDALDGEAVRAPA
jgi:chlorite dismutase